MDVPIRIRLAWVPARHLSWQSIIWKRTYNPQSMRKKRSSIAPKNKHISFRCNSWALRLCMYNFIFIVSRSVLQLQLIFTEYYVHKSYVGIIKTRHAHLLYVQEVVTHFITATCYTILVTTSWTYSISI